jgi:hypothetical protein
VSEPAPLATAKEPAAPPAPKPPAVVAKPPVPVPPAVAVAPTVPVPARKEPAYGAPAAPQGLDQETYRQPAPARDTVEPPAQLRALVTQAQQSLARREFRRAMGLADNALALDPNNLQARDIRRRAQEGEKRAFEEIKIE